MQREFFEAFGPKLPFEFRDQLKQFETLFGQVQSQRHTEESQHPRM